MVSRGEIVAKINLIINTLLVLNYTRPFFKFIFSNELQTYFLSRQRYDRPQVQIIMG